MMFPLVREMAEPSAPFRVPVAVACRVLGSSQQAYYKWRRTPVSVREAEEQHLIGVLRELHDRDPEGGYRVLADDLADAGYQVSERRVWRLCKVAGISSTIVKRKTRYRKAGPPVHDDLVRREFTTDGPNRLWLMDITEHWTAEGKPYCCAVNDVFSNRIVAYAIDSRMKVRLAVDALELTVAHRGNPRGVVVHSDRGGQGEFNWSSQHLYQEVFDGSSSAGRGQGGSSEAPLAGASEVSETRRGGVLGRDRERAARGGSRGGLRCGARGRRKMVPTRWRHGAIRHRPAAIGPLPLVR